MVKADVASEKKRKNVRKGTRRMEDVHAYLYMEHSEV